MTVRSFRNLACLAVVTAFLVSCSSTHRLYMESLRLAFRSGPEKSLADIQQSKIDLMQIELGDRNPAFLALAYLENDQHKWVSADHAVFVFHHDKLVQTSGFATDVLSTSHLDTNPLVDIASANTTTWQYTIDIANHEYGLPVESTFKKRWHGNQIVLRSNFHTRQMGGNCAYRAFYAILGQCIRLGKQLPGRACLGQRLLQ